MKMPLPDIPQFSLTADWVEKEHHFRTSSGMASMSILVFNRLDVKYSS